MRGSILRLCIAQAGAYPAIGFDQFRLQPFFPGLALQTPQSTPLKAVQAKAGQVIRVVWPSLRGLLHGDKLWFIRQDQECSETHLLSDSAKYHSSVATIINPASPMNISFDFSPIKEISHLPYVGCMKLVDLNQIVRLAHPEFSFKVANINVSPSLVVGGEVALLSLDWKNTPFDQDDTLWWLETSQNCGSIGEPSVNGSSLVSSGSSKNQGPMLRFDFENSAPGSTFRLCVSSVALDEIIEYPFVQVRVINIQVAFLYRIVSAGPSTNVSVSYSEPWVDVGNYIWFQHTVMPCNLHPPAESAALWTGSFVVNATNTTVIIPFDMANIANPPFDDLYHLCVWSPEYPRRVYEYVPVQIRIVSPTTQQQLPIPGDPLPTEISIVHPLPTFSLSRPADVLYDQYLSLNFTGTLGSFDLISVVGAAAHQEHGCNGTAEEYLLFWADSSHAAGAAQSGQAGPVNTRLLSPGRYWVCLHPAVQLTYGSDMVIPPGRQVGWVVVAPSSSLENHFALNIDKPNQMPRLALRLFWPAPSKSIDRMMFIDADKDCGNAPSTDKLTRVEEYPLTTLNSTGNSYVVAPAVDYFGNTGLYKVCLCVGVGEPERTPGALDGVCPRSAAQGGGDWFRGFGAAGTALLHDVVLHNAVPSAAGVLVYTAVSLQSNVTFLYSKTFAPGDTVIWFTRSDEDCGIVSELNGKESTRTPPVYAPPSGVSIKFDFSSLEPSPLMFRLCADLGDDITSGRLSADFIDVGVFVIDLAVSPTNPARSSSSAIHFDFKSTLIDQDRVWFVEVNTGCSQSSTVPPITMFSTASVTVDTSLDKQVYNFDFSNLAHGFRYRLCVGRGSGAVFEQVLDYSSVFITVIDTTVGTTTTSVKNSHNQAVDLTTSAFDPADYIGFVRQDVDCPQEMGASPVSSSVLKVSTGPPFSFDFASVPSASASAFPFRLCVRSPSGTSTDYDLVKVLVESIAISPQSTILDPGLPNVFTIAYDPGTSLGFGDFVWWERVDYPCETSRPASSSTAYSKASFIGFSGIQVEFDFSAVQESTLSFRMCVDVSGAGNRILDYESTKIRLTKTFLHTENVVAGGAVPIWLALNISGTFQTGNLLWFQVSDQMCERDQGGFGSSAFRSGVCSLSSSDIAGSTPIDMDFAAVTPPYHGALFRVCIERANGNVEDYDILRVAVTGSLSSPTTANPTIATPTIVPPPTIGTVPTPAPTHSSDVLAFVPGIQTFSFRHSPNQNISIVWTFVGNLTARDTLVLIPGQAGSCSNRSTIAHEFWAHFQGAVQKDGPVTSESFTTDGALSPGKYFLCYCRAQGLSNCAAEPSNLLRQVGYLFFIPVDSLQQTFSIATGVDSQGITAKFKYPMTDRSRMALVLPGLPCGSSVPVKTFDDLYGVEILETSPEAPDTLGRHGLSLEPATYHNVSGVYDVCFCLSETEQDSKGCPIGAFSNPPWYQSYGGKIGSVLMYDLWMNFPFSRMASVQKSTRASLVITDRASTFDSSDAWWLVREDYVCGTKPPTTNGYIYTSSQNFHESSSGEPYIVDFQYLASTQVLYRLCVLKRSNGQIFDLRETGVYVTDILLLPTEPVRSVGADISITYADSLKSNIDSVWFVATKEPCTKQFPPVASNISTNAVLMTQQSATHTFDMSSIEAHTQMRMCVADLSAANNVFDYSKVVIAVVEDTLAADPQIVMNKQNQRIRLNFGLAEVPQEGVFWFQRETWGCHKVPASPSEHNSDTKIAIQIRSSEAWDFSGISESQLNLDGFRLCYLNEHGLITEYPQVKVHVSDVSLQTKSIPAYTALTMLTLDFRGKLFDLYDVFWFLEEGSACQGPTPVVSSLSATGPGYQVYNSSEIGIQTQNTAPSSTFFRLCICRRTNPLVPHLNDFIDLKPVKLTVKDIKLLNDTVQQDYLQSILMKYSPVSLPQGSLVWFALDSTDCSVAGVPSTQDSGSTPVVGISQIGGGTAASSTGIPLTFDFSRARVASVYKLCASVQGQVHDFWDNTVQVVGVSLATKSVIPWHDQRIVLSWSKGLLQPGYIAWFDRSGVCNLPNAGYEWPSSPSRSSSVELSAAMGVYFFDFTGVSSSKTPVGLCVMDLLRGTQYFPSASLLVSDVVIDQKFGRPLEYNLITIRYTQSLGQGLEKLLWVPVGTECQEGFLMTPLSSVSTPPTGTPTLFDFTFTSSGTQVPFRLCAQFDSTLYDFDHTSIMIVDVSVDTSIASAGRYNNVTLSWSGTSLIEGDSVYFTSDIVCFFNHEASYATGTNIVVVKNSGDRLEFDFESVLASRTAMYRLCVRSRIYGIMEYSPVNIKVVDVTFDRIFVGTTSQEMINISFLQSLSKGDVVWFVKSTPCGQSLGEPGQKRSSSVIVGSPGIYSFDFSYANAKADYGPWSLCVAESDNSVQLFSGPMLAVHTMNVELYPRSLAQGVQNVTIFYPPGSLLRGSDEVFFRLKSVGCDGPVHMEEAASIGDSGEAVIMNIVHNPSRQSLQLCLLRDGKTHHIIGDVVYVTNLEIGSKAVRNTQGQSVAFSWGGGFVREGDKVSFVREGIACNTSSAYERTSWRQILPGEVGPDTEFVSLDFDFSLFTTDQVPARLCLLFLEDSSLLDLDTKLYVADVMPYPKGLRPVSRFSFAIDWSGQAVKYNDALAWVASSTACPFSGDDWAKLEASSQNSNVITHARLPKYKHLLDLSRIVPSYRYRLCVWTGTHTIDYNHILIGVSVELGASFVSPAPFVSIDITYDGSLVAGDDRIAFVEVNSSCPSTELELSSLLGASTVTSSSAVSVPESGGVAIFNFLNVAAGSTMRICVHAGGNPNAFDILDYSSIQLIISSGENEPSTETLQPTPSSITPSPFPVVSNSKIVCESSRVKNNLNFPIFFFFGPLLGFRNVNCISQFLHIVATFL